MTATFVIGLTGSIGMGKSTTSQMFKDAGIPTWSADDAVHALYAPNGAGTAEVQKLCPDAVTKTGVDRAILSDWIAVKPERLAMLENLIHPLVAQDRQSFLNNADADIVLLDIPLLFETGASATVDAIVVVTTSADEQRRRVLARHGMDNEKFELITSKQTPDSEKRRRADYIIETTTLDAAQDAVQNVLKDIKAKLSHA